MIDFEKLHSVRHPFDEPHNNQMEALTNFLDEKREHMAQTIRVGNASFRHKNWELGKSILCDGQNEFMILTKKKRISYFRWRSVDFGGAVPF